VAITSTTNSSVGISWAGIKLPGDVNGDGTINSADLGLVKAHFGSASASGSPVDVNDDGVIDLADYNFIKAGMGATLSGYNIERSTDGINFKQIGGTSATSTSYLDNTGLSDDQSYFYRVRARSSTSTVSDPSAAALATTRAGAVGNLNVISYTNDTLIVDWSDASGETQYRLERSLNGTSGWTTVISDLGVNTPMYTNSGLNAGTKYYYRVVTVDALGDSATSSVASAFTRLAAPALTFTNKQTNQMAIAWPAVTGATTYTVERSNDNATWTTVSTNQAGLTYTDNNVTPVQKYYYRVTAYNPTVPGVPATIAAASPSTTTLPSPWVSSDIGINNSDGSETGAVALNGSTLTAIGGGADIWGGSDQFRFTYVPINGNATITARVISIDNTNYYARAGVMIRNSTSTTSKSAQVMVHQSDAGVRFQYRTGTGGSTKEVVGGGAAQAAPYWVRLTRTITDTNTGSSTFKAEMSPDGATWTTIFTQSINTLNKTMLIGLALTPRDGGYLNKVLFDNVTITSADGTVTLGSASSSESETGTAFAGGATSNSATASSSPSTSAATLAAAINLSSNKSAKSQEHDKAAIAATSSQSNSRSAQQHRHTAVDHAITAWFEDHFTHRSKSSARHTSASGLTHDLALRDFLKSK
jgi:hypothetical protein